MDDLRTDYTNNKMTKKIKMNNIYIILSTNKYKILLLLIALFVIFFPTFTGTLIGKWITSFIGSIIKYISL